MKKAWVIGAGGLLGSALCRALQADGIIPFTTRSKFVWDDESTLITQLLLAVREFSVDVGPDDRWAIYWAAGRGTMGTPAASLAMETRALSATLAAIESDTRLSDSAGAFSFSSSAGALYAGSKEEVITEESLLMPTTEYAHEKIRQEEAVRSFSDTNKKIALLIARFSTLYGAGQSTGKQQGLLTHLAGSILRNKPVQIYVPLDTIRDYLAVDDAAAAMISSLNTLCDSPRLITKIIASELPTTIAEIVNIFKRVARRSPLVVTSASQLSVLYSRRVQFRSVVLPLQSIRRPRSLLVGIAQLLEAERESYVRSSPT